MHPTMFLTMHIYKALHICSVRDYYKCPKLHYNTVFYGYYVIFHFHTGRLLFICSHQTETSSGALAHLCGT